MALIILRCVFFAVAIALGFRLSTSTLLQGHSGFLTWLSFLGVLLLAGGVVFGDVAIRSKRLTTITAIYFGTFIGLVLTYVFQLALSPLLPQDNPEAIAMVQLGLAMIVCYSCISILLQTQDDFRFIIPYVEFAKEVKGLKPYVLDTSVVIDGRIADLVETNVLDNQLIMPRFILTELQAIADSSDKLRRARGRRGLDILNRLRTNQN